MQCGTTTDGFRLPCKRAVVSSILTGGSTYHSASALVETFSWPISRAIDATADTIWIHCHGHSRTNGRRQRGHDERGQRHSAALVALARTYARMAVHVHV